MVKKICVSGKIASGKSITSKLINSVFDIPIVSFGNIQRKWHEANLLPTNREAMQAIGKMIVEANGDDSYVEWILNASPGINWKESLIVEGFRHPDTYVKFQEVFPESILVYCVCLPNTQLRRVMGRDNLTENEALTIVNAYIERANENDFLRVADVVRDETVSEEELIQKIIPLL